jgi:predicted transcriptional regulator
LNAVGDQLMMIVINLTPELEEQLRKKAIHQGQDVSLVATELLASVLEWEAQDSEEAIKGIQQGLNDFEAGNFRPFNEFAEEQRRKYNLPT